MSLPAPELPSPDATLMGCALDGMCVGLVLTNAAGRLSWANRSAQAVLGLDLHSMRGRPLDQLLRDPNLAGFWHQSHEQGPVHLGEVALHWPASRQLKVNVSQCLDHQGTCIGRALLFCDVTGERSAQVQLSAEVSQRLLDLTASRTASAGPAPHAGLTARELRVLCLVGQGHGNQEIADQLHVAASTIRSHLKHVYSKLHMTARSEAIAYALRHGLA